ncbi:MAG TPA: hypothetical protein VFH39_00525 [Candidatus Saccharimonadales bacterium]|nr:hypothetical protein [Candidatus Saccharimonadales bacterium]
MEDKAKNEAKDVMNNPDDRAKIEKIARDKGMSLDEAKDHFMKHGDKS